MRALRKWLALRLDWLKRILDPADSVDRTWAPGEILVSMLNRTHETNFQTITTFLWKDIEISVIVIPAAKVRQTIETQRTVH